MQTLGVDTPGAAVIALLDTPLGDTLDDLLEQVPDDLDLADADEDVIVTGSPASQAWRLLRDDAKTGWVRTAKLLACKGPRLLPVWDDVVDCALGWNVLNTGGYWIALHSELRADDQALHRQLVAAVAGPGPLEGLSPLRYFDVALWMRHHRQHRACCPGMPL